MKFTRAQLFIAIALLGASSPAAALGWGTPRSAAVLGRPLDFAVPVRLEPEEEFASECVDAQVHYGEARVARSQVSIRVEPVPGMPGERLVRVQTTVPVEEPIVTVEVSTGCGARIARRFVAFADPPSAPVSAVAIAPAVPDTARPAGRAPAPAPSRADVKRSAPSSPVAGGAQGVPAARAGRADRRRPEDATAPRPGDRGAAPATRPPTLARDATRTPERTSRLKLEPLEGDAGSPPRLDTPATASNAAAWAALNLTPEQAAADRQRLQAMEQSLQQLREESARTRESLEVLQAQLRRARQERYDNPLVYALGLLCIALAAALFWAVIRGRTATPRAWWSPSVLADSRRRALEEDGGRAASTRRISESEDGGGSTTGAAIFSGPGDAPSPPPAPPMRAPAVARGPAAPAARPPVAMAAEDQTGNGKVSVEELIDLEQQAEFFIALGQEESAIALLQTHVQHHPDGSPLPYLKLMELHQQRGDREAYEAVRADFNRRFNAYAPAWEDTLADGRSLEEYPSVISRLQRLWETPTQALEVLQASLLRRDASSTTFDLPAYRELLLLYSVARDRVEYGGDEGAVDILLPLGEPRGATSVSTLEPLTATTPVPAYEGDAPAFEVDLPLEPPGTAPLEHPPQRLIEFEPIDLDLPSTRESGGRGDGRRER